MPYDRDKDYAPVENPIPGYTLGRYFVYDKEKKSYRLSGKTIPSAAKTGDIREYLYTHGFDIDGIHYVRYKRSADSSRDGRCIFIAEPLYAYMMAWSSCRLSGDSVSDLGYYRKQLYNY